MFLLKYKITLFYLLSFAFICFITRCHSMSLIIIFCYSLLFVVTRCHLLSFVLTCCTTRCHSLSLFVLLAATHYHSLYHSLSFVVICCTTRCHLLSLVVIRCTTRCHALSLYVQLACLFIRDCAGISISHIPLIYLDCFLTYNASK